jgi:hypothetical protein
MLDNEHVLICSQCYHGNKSITTEAINAVIEFCQGDGISRISSNSKDAIYIEKKPVTMRFMETTSLDAFHEFNKCNSGVVGCSTFYSLRPRNVKIISPHETCMCIYHENVQLLLQVRKLVILLLIEIMLSNNRHGTMTINEYARNLSVEQSNDLANANRYLFRR